MDGLTNLYAGLSAGGFLIVDDSRLRPAARPSRTFAASAASG